MGLSTSGRLRGTVVLSPGQWRISRLYAALCHALALEVYQAGLEVPNISLGTYSE